MQNSRKLEALVKTFSDKQNFLYTVGSLSVVFPDLSEENINQLLSRANKSGLLERVCKGIYINTQSGYDPSTLLFLVAKTLRYPECMYVSLETVLSSMSIISQQMLSYITIITSGRSGTINCSRFGKIEFVHSDCIKLTPQMVKYDIMTDMFWATENQAMNDMIKHRRRLLSMVEDKG